MNRFVSLLLVALCLAAVSLAQPAHAQWTKGTAYYDPSSTLSKDANTTFTNTPVGSITLTSTPTGGYYGTNAAGSYNGILDQPYVWTGDPKARPGFGYTTSYGVSGSCTGSGSANSNVNSGFHGTTVNSPNQTYSATGAASNVFVFQPDDTRTTVTLQMSLGAATARGPAQRVYS